MCVPLRSRTLLSLFHLSINFRSTKRKREQKRMLNVAIGAIAITRQGSVSAYLGSRAVPAMIQQAFAATAVIEICSDIR